MKIKTRALSLFMALVMLLTMAAPAFAETGKTYTVAIGNANTSFTIVFSDDSSDSLENIQKSFSNVPAGGTLGASCGVKNIVELSHTSGEDFVSWNVVGVTASGPSNIASGLTTEQMLAYQLPEGDWDIITFDPVFNNQGGNQGGGPGTGPQTPAVGGEEGVCVGIDSIGAQINVTLDLDLEDDANEPFHASSMNDYFLGLLENGTTLAENGVLDIEVVFEDDPNRRFLGWDVMESSTGITRDHAELLTTEELLEFEIPEDVPAYSNYYLNIVAVWDKDLSYYLSTVTYMAFGGSYIRYPDGDRPMGTMGGGFVPLGGSLADAVLYDDPIRYDDEFVGWRRVINILSFDENGRYKSASYDTSDKNLYKMEDIAGHFAPEEPCHNVYYIAVWQSDVDAGRDPVEHFGAGGATGVSNASRAAIFFSGDGNIEIIEKYTDGYSKTGYAGYYGFYNIRKNISIGQAFESAGETGMTYGINAHRDGYNFTGWNVYSIDERTIISVPEDISIDDDEALLDAVGPYRLDIGPDESKDGYFIYEGYTKSTLMYEKLSHEAVFAIPVTSNWFAVPTWELSEKLPVEIPGLNDPGYEYYVSIQEDIQLPLNVDENRYGDVGKVKDSLIKQMDHWAEKRSTKLDGSKIVEIKLLAYEKATGEWSDVTHSIPPEGIEITIPYPDKNKDSTGSHIGWQNGKYVVFHFISSGANAGTIEELACTNTPQGLKVTVHSLSPFAIARQADAEPTTPTTPTTPTAPSEGGAGRQNPNTGV